MTYAFFNDEAGLNKTAFLKFDRRTNWIKTIKS